MHTATRYHPSWCHTASPSRPHSIHHPHVISYPATRPPNHLHSIMLTDGAVLDTLCARDRDPDACTFKGFHAQPVADQEGVFGRTKGVAPEGSIKMDPLPEHSHLAHVDLRDGTTGDDAAPKRHEITRRSTPYGQCVCVCACVCVRGRAGVAHNVCAANL